MIEEFFSEIYDKFQLNFYKSIFNNDEELTIVESICLEIIRILGKPTVSELTEFMNVSQPNMTYRVSRLVEKGYVTKTQSEVDKREFLLEPTEKCLEFDRKNKEYIYKVAGRMEDRFNEKDITISGELLKTTSDELMYELNKYLK